MSNGGLLDMDDVVKGEQVYCLCRQPYEKDQFMIECDVCKDWFHGSCVGIEECRASLIDVYVCPNCQRTKCCHSVNSVTLPNPSRTSLSHMDCGSHKKEKVLAGSAEFVRRLTERKFPGASQLPVVELRGCELNLEYLTENGFRRPILVHCKDGLDLRVPDNDFSVRSVEEHVGASKVVDYIDVASQDEGQMTLGEWVEYFSSADRKSVRNVISLEFTGTRLAKMISPPRIVNELSWVSNHWPSDVPVEDVQFVRPEVQRYCLMGVAGSYTDFHVDFGGTSVWYHILRGEKIFYLIPPNSKNLALYEDWMVSPDKQETFFADLVDVCYRCVIKAGETVFLPSGWIHSVLTPVDSMVFGGNFLHSLCIPMQLRAYRIEKNTRTPTKYMFPNFETLHWFVAKHIVDMLTDYREEEQDVPAYLIRGADRMYKALRDWTADAADLRNNGMRSNIPDTISHRRLLKDFARELGYIQNGGPGIKSVAGCKRSNSAVCSVARSRPKLDKTF